MSQSKQEAINIYSEYDGGQAEATAALEGGTVIYSAYETGCYEGAWLLVYVDRDGKLMMDRGSHCSCNGPEFGASPTTLAELRNFDGYMCGSNIQTKADLVKAIDEAIAAGFISPDEPEGQES